MISRDNSRVKNSLFSPRDFGMSPPSLKKLPNRSPNGEKQKKKPNNQEKHNAFLFPSQGKKEKEKVELPGLFYPDLECIEMTEEENNQILNSGQRDWNTTSIKPFNTFIEGSKRQKAHKKENDPNEKCENGHGYTEKLEMNLGRSKIGSWHGSNEVSSKYKSKRSDSESIKNQSLKTLKTNQKAPFAYSSRLKLKANELLKSKIKIKASEGLKNIQNILSNRHHMSPLNSKKLREIGSLKVSGQIKAKDPHCISIEAAPNQLSLIGPIRDSIIGFSRPSFSKLESGASHDLRITTEPAHIRTSRSPKDKKKLAFGKNHTGKRSPVIIVSPKAQTEEDSYANGLMKKIQLKIDNEKLNPYPTIKLYDRKYDVASFCTCLNNKGDFLGSAKKKSSFVGLKDPKDKKNTSKGKKDLQVHVQGTQKGIKLGETVHKKEEVKHPVSPALANEGKNANSFLHQTEDEKIGKNPIVSKTKLMNKIPISPKKQVPQIPAKPNAEIEKKENKSAGGQKARTKSITKKCSEPKEEKEKKTEKNSQGASERKTNLPSKSSHGNGSHEVKKDANPENLEALSTVQKMLAFFDREHQHCEKRDDVQKKLETMRAFIVCPRQQNRQIYSHSTSHIDSKSNNTPVLNASNQQQKEFQIESRIEEYLISEVIGTGSYGVVNIAIDAKTGLKFAIKTYQKERLLDQQKMRNVKREIDNLQFLSHPFVVKLVRVIHTLKTIHLVMELISTQTLETYCQKVGGTIPETHVRFLALKIAQGLAYIHSKGVAHRDLKLENVIVDDFLNLRIIDFGFSFKITGQHKLNVYCGTPCYMAPEIVKRRPYNGFPADVWAFGIILFRVTQGHFPFAGSTDEELFSKIMSGKVPPAKNISPELEDLIGRLFQVDPSKRLTASEIVEHEFFQS